MKIATVLGARPQFIKAAVVSRAFKEMDVEEVLIHTGQHYDRNMSDVFFKELSLPNPQHHLGVNGGRHGEMTGRMLQGIEHVLLEEQPDALLVYGDTNSTLAGALAAAKLDIRIAHVEAGLRSFNLKMPEEINRILTDRISTWLFTPTDAAGVHLHNEGIPQGRIYQVGDVMYDVAIYFGNLPQLEGGLLSKLDLLRGGFILATIHRAENTNDLVRLGNILGALDEVGKQHRIVLPLHPRTRQIINSDLELARFTRNICILDPVSYLDMVQLEKNAALIVTDSGGVQKEAFFHRVPCITLRDETEWVELVEAGWNKLIPPVDVHSVSRGIISALDVHTERREISPYGLGAAAKSIANIICASL